MSSISMIEKRIATLKKALKQLTKFKNIGLSPKEHNDFLAKTHTIAFILDEKKLGSGEYKPRGVLNIPSSFKDMNFFANFAALHEEMGPEFVNQCIAAIDAGIEMYEEDLIRLQEKPVDEQVSDHFELTTDQKDVNLLLIQNLENHLVNLIINQIMMNPENYPPESRYIPEQRKKVVKEKNDFKCQICAEQFSEDDLEVDHIYPYSLGGSNFPINLMSLCKKCNLNKSAKLDYYKSKEGRNKLEMNIRDFVKNIPIILNFGKWIEEMSQYRKKEDKIE